MTPNLDETLEQLVSAAEAAGYVFCAVGDGFWIREPAQPLGLPDGKPDPICELNIARRDPALRAALAPYLQATGRNAWPAAA